MEVFTGKKPGTEFREAYSYTSPEIASRSEEPKWVDDIVFLSQGGVRVKENGKFEVSYGIFRVIKWRLGVCPGFGLRRIRWNNSYL